MYCRWKDGQKLQPEDKYRHVKNGNDYALTVFDLTMADRGEYIVQAENEFGKGECPAFLNVRGMGKSRRIYNWVKYPPVIQNQQHVLNMKSADPAWC